MEKSLFDSLLVMISQYRSRFIKAFLMVLFSNSLLILNPLIFRQAITALEGTSEKSKNLLEHYLGSYFHSLGTWAFILILIAAISAYLKYWMRIEFISISRDVERVVRSQLFERIQSQSRAFYDRHGIGDLLSRLTNDISAYRDVLGPGIMYPLFFLTLVIPGLCALFYISSKLAVLTLIPMFCIPLLNALLRKKIYMVSLEVQKFLGLLSNMVQEHFSAMRIVKGYVIENATNGIFRKLCLRLSQLNLRLMVLQGLLFPFFTLLTKILTIVLVMFSGMIILRAWGELSIADFVSFMWIQAYIFFPVLMLTWILPIYERGRAAYDRLVEIYDEPIEIYQTPKTQLHIPPKADIEFRDLTFTYPLTDTPSLSHLNLTIKGGSFIGITGPLGSGKTTLFRLINREYEIPCGKILIAGHDIHDFSWEAFTQSIVTVEQIPFLFSKSIRENLRFGREEASQEEIELVAQHADLHSSVIEFPDQYDTMIGERGVTLSGGQKQRVAVARAFLVNRSILLLDDIFSSVDAATEKRIFHAMKENFQGKTVLLISHRVSILEQMDRVVYMKKGTIEEEGTPSELLAKKGYYAALVELQTQVASRDKG